MHVIRTRVIPIRHLWVHYCKLLYSSNIVNLMLHVEVSWKKSFLMLHAFLLKSITFSFSVSVSRKRTQTLWKYPKLKLRNAVFSILLETSYEKYQCIGCSIAFWKIKLKWILKSATLQLTRCF